MSFRPYPTQSGFIFSGIALVAAAAGVYLINLILRSSLVEAIGLLMWLLLILAIFSLAFYGAIVTLKLGYKINRNGLIIHWGPTNYIIPIETITAIVPGKTTAPATFSGLTLAGLRFGRGKTAEYGPVQYHTTAELSESLLVVTPSQTYAISPLHPDRFIRAWSMRQSLGPTQHWSPHIEYEWPLNTFFFTDTLVRWLLGVALLICLALFGYLSSIFPDLPTNLPIHFDALGQADRIANKSALLLLPLAGILIIGLNTLFGSFVYQQEKTAAYLLWGSTLTLQLCLWVALLTLTN
jgi:hypothetical protein